MPVRISVTITSTALTTWLIIVASAAPNTPMPNPTTRRMSSTMFTPQHTIRKYSGRLESPTARRMPEPML